MTKIKKAVIPIAGLGTRFLPLSKALPKELFPLVDLPVLQYIIEEVAASGIREIIFVSRPEKEIVLEYFQKEIPRRQAHKAKYKNLFWEELKKLENLRKKVSFLKVFQKEPKGDGDALLCAKDLIREEPFAVCFADDVIFSKIPALKHMVEVFEKYKKPVIGVCRVPKESFQFYGMIEGKKISKRVYQIKKIVEKPPINKAPSNLALVGRYVLTPEVFEYLEEAQSQKKSEIILNEILGEKIKEGKEILAYEFEGKWLECGNKFAYLKSNFYLSLKHPQFGKELKKCLRAWRN